MYKAALAIFLIGASAVAQDTQAKKIDHASAYYHYALAHMYAEMAEMPGNRAENLNKAIENYKAAIQADPTSPMLTEELSDVYFQFGRAREAQDDAEAALRKDPNDVPAHRLLARVYMRQIGDPQQQRIDENMLQKAIAEYQKIAQLAPNDADSLVMLGRLEKIAQNTGEAEKAYKRALAADPDNDEAQAGLAMVYLDEGNNEEASAILKKLADKNPSQRSLRQLASAYEQMKEYSLAAETLNRALAQNPQDASDLQRAVAQDLVLAKRYDDALKIYQQLVAQEPGDADSYVRMSEIYREKKDFAKAREMAAKASTIDSGNLEIRYNEVLNLEAEGKMPEAIQAIKDILTSTQKRSYNQQEKGIRIRLLEELGQKSREAGQIDQAVDAFRQMQDLDQDLAPRVEPEIIQTYTAGKEYNKAEQEAQDAAKKWPNDRGVNISLAFAEADLGKTDAAAAIVRKQLDQKQDAQTYLNLAQVYDKGRKFNEEAKAIDQAEKIAQTKDEKVLVFFQRGAMFEKQNKVDAAEAAFRKVLEIDPENAEALNYLGYMLADRGLKLNDALGYIKKANEQVPNNGAFLDSLGWIYFKLGRLPEAEENLRKAVELDPRDATVHDHLGDVLLKESKLREAVGQWEISYKEWNLSSPADLDAKQMAKVKDKLDNAKLRLAKEGSSPKQNQ
ncbi:MAG TPA: tetratricopeptide repeat protein [Bryobacteraceae bacterium]|jgi:tetratricopeptide (TPR) repeat protein|nr:tetratricopeptide repeat protein [Bryobacteraceae bacterium]